MIRNLAIRIGSTVLSLTGLQEKVSKCRSPMGSRWKINPSGAGSSASCERSEGRGQAPGPGREPPEGEGGEGAWKAEAGLTPQLPCTDSPLAGSREWRIYPRTKGKSSSLSAPDS